jgi:tRNA(Met) C34 N-acetyltransferase TmcA
MRPPQQGQECIAVCSAVGEVGLVLDPWQAEVLRSPSKRTLMLCSRQSGKSTTAAIMSIGQAVTAPGSLTLLVSPSLRQSTELFRTVMGYFRKLSDAPEILAESVTRLELANGSRIVSLPGTEGTIRGYAAASLIVIDEAARVAEELLAQCTPNACGIEWKAGRPLDSSRRDSTDPVR